MLKIISTITMLLGISSSLFARDLPYGMIKLRETFYDFGDVPRGTTSSYRFVFENVGKGPLVIQGVHAACGCTVVEFDKTKVYQPGESGFFDVKFDSTNFIGSLTKTISVATNEKPSTNRTVTLKARVTSDLVVDPPLINFGDVRAHTPRTESVVISPARPEAFRITELVFDRSKFSVTEAKRPDGKIELTLTLADNLMPGALKETIIIKNTSDHLKELPVPVRATIIGAISVAPTYLEYGSIDSLTPVRRSISLSSTKEKGEDVVVKADRVELFLNGQPAESGVVDIKLDQIPHEMHKKLVWIEIKNKGRAKGSMHGKLYLTTTSKEEPQVTVDFYAFLQE